MSQNHVAGEILVKWTDGPDSPAAAIAHAEIGGRVLHTSALTGWQHVDLPPGMATGDGLMLYSLSEGCERAEQNDIADLHYVPNDSSYGSQWHLPKISAPAAWDAATGGTVVVVGVCGTGVDTTHSDIAFWGRQSNGEHGIDAADGTDLSDEANSHDTHVAGIIAAKTNNAQGIAGVAENHAQIMVLKKASSTGGGTLSALSASLDYAVARKNEGVNLRVICHSWGQTGYNQAMYDIFAAVGAAGILNVCSAGNGNLTDTGYSNEAGEANINYPSSFNLDSIIAVASSETNDSKTNFSNFGATTVDLAAPGRTIHSTLSGGGYGNRSGTSMAAPMVAGAAALLWSHNAALSVAQVKAALITTCDPVAALSGLVLSGGRLNMQAALQSVLVASETVVPRLRWLRA